MHHAAALEFGDLGEAQPVPGGTRKLRCSCLPGELASGGDDKASPKLRGVPVEAHGTLVVVTLIAERYPENRIVLRVMFKAPGGAPVRTL